MKRWTMPVLATSALVLAAIPSGAWASHEVTDDRSTTSLQDFRAAVDPWIDPWIEISGTSIADDHAPWLAFSLYDLLLGIKPERCYLDTYAAYWAVAADLRALGQAPTQEQLGAAMERVLEGLDRASSLAERDAGGCHAGRDGQQAGAQAATDAPAVPRSDPALVGSSSHGRVIEIEASASLQFLDEGYNRLDAIEVAPGESIVFRVHNSAGFMHSFYIGTESELMEPWGTTDSGIPTWVSGVRELAWIVPDETSDLGFACTVPGHFESMHGTFTVVSA